MAKGHLVWVIGSEVEGAGMKWNHPGRWLFTFQFIPNRSDDLKEKALTEARLPCCLHLDLDNMAGNSIQLGFGDTALVCGGGGGEFLSILFYL